MRLVDLEPRWLLASDGRRIGFIFKSPTKPDCYQSCFAEETPSGVQWDLFDALFPDDHCMVQGCRPDFAWAITPAIEHADFESLTVHPSIDGSRGGNWHGFVQNGNIVGGI